MTVTELSKKAVKGLTKERIDKALISVMIEGLSDGVIDWSVPELIPVVEEKLLHNYNLTHTDLIFSIKQSYHINFSDVACDTHYYRLNEKAVELLTLVGVIK